MGAWIKFFADNSLEHGRDKDISKGEASWTQGRLNDIIEVRLFNELLSCSLSALNTCWHQFDRFSVVVSEGTQQSIRTHRVVQAEIKPYHIGFLLMSSHTGGNYSWVIVQDLRHSKKAYSFCKLLTEKDVGKWLTLILPDKDYPRITFSTKGKMHDNKHIPK